MSDAPALIAELRATSGLTDRQIGRLFGASSRTLHLWASGNPMGATQEKRLVGIADVVRALPGSTPVERRGALISSAAGPSLFARLKQDAPADQVIQTILPLSMRLGLDPTGDDRRA